MAEKKRVTKKKKNKTARKTKATPRTKPASRRKVSGKKPVRTAKKKTAKKKTSPRSASKEIRSPEPSTLGGRTFPAGERSSRSGLRSSSAGQSGDVQGLSRRRVADSESVEELVEEGQAREAAAISGVEDALDPDESEVYTREVPADDVPEEYSDED
jgi:hypothetical protein